MTHLLNLGKWVKALVDFMVGGLAMSPWFMKNITTLVNEERERVIRSIPQRQSVWKPCLEPGLMFAHCLIFAQWCIMFFSACEGQIKQLTLFLEWARMLGSQRPVFKNKIYFLKFISSSQILLPLPVWGIAELYLYPWTNVPLRGHACSCALSPNSSICSIFLEAKLPAHSPPLRAPDLTSEVHE